MIAFQFFLRESKLKYCRRLRFKSILSSFSVVIFLSLKGVKNINLSSNLYSLFRPIYTAALHLCQKQKQKQSTKGDEENYCNIYWQLFISQ